MVYLYSGIIIANTLKFICIFFQTNIQRQRHVSVLVPHPFKLKLETMGRGSVCRKKALHEQVSRRGEEKIMKYKNILIPICKNE